MIRKTKAAILLSLLIVPVVVIACITMYNKPHINVAKTAPDISSITSQTLLNDFLSDENQANSKYLEQIIQVTGVISKLETAKGGGIVTLRDEDSFGSVMCHLSPEETEKMESLKKGQSVTVKGICTGYLMDVILVKCVIIN